MVRLSCRSAVGQLRARRDSGEQRGSDYVRLAVLTKALQIDVFAGLDRLRGTPIWDPGAEDGTGAVVLGAADRDVMTERDARMRSGNFAILALDRTQWMTASCLPFPRSLKP